MNEQALLEALLEEYAKKGYNPQAILSNSLFQRLSIDSQISLLRDNLEKLTGKPTFLGALSPTKILPASILAGATSALAAKGLATAAGKKFSLGLGLGTGLVGAATAAIPALMAAKKNFKKDLSTSESLRDNRYLQAIVGRSDTNLAKPQGNPLLSSISSRINTNMIASS